MSLFNRRTNYLAEGDIYKDSKTGKYFFEVRGDMINKYLLKEGSSYYLTWGRGKTLFNSIEDIMRVSYSMALEDHLKQIHKDITYSKGIKV